ncbi:hypothetical protein K7432_009273, partial [Basidiobolus ranarum]
MNFHKQIFKKKLPAPPERKISEASGVASSREDEDYFNSLFVETTTNSNKPLANDQVYFSVKQDSPTSPTTPISPISTVEEYSANESVESLPICTASTSQNRPATLQLSDELETCSVNSDGSLSSYESHKISSDFGGSKLPEQPANHRRTSHHEFSWSPFGSLKNKLSRALHHVTPTTSIKVNIEELGTTSGQRVGTYTTMYKELQEKETGLSSWLCHIKAQKNGAPEASRYFKPQTAPAPKPPVSDTVTVTPEQTEKLTFNTEPYFNHPDTSVPEDNHDFEKSITEEFEHRLKESAGAYITPPLDEGEIEPNYLNEAKYLQADTPIEPVSDNLENSHNYINSRELAYNSTQPTSPSTPNNYEGRPPRPLPIPKPRQHNATLNTPATTLLTPPSQSELSQAMSDMRYSNEYDQASPHSDAHSSPQHPYSYQSRPAAPMVTPYPPHLYSVYGPSTANSSATNLYPPEGSNAYPPYPANYYQSRYVMRSPMNHENWNYANSTAVNHGYPPAQQYPHPMYHPRAQLSVPL